jgi:quercetin dioxygenase-like cupin family protein
MSKTLRVALTLSALAIATGAIACRDTTTALSHTGIGEPNFTVAVGFTSTVVARGNLGTFHIQSKAGDYDAELKSHDNTDIVVVNVDVAPGGHSGWHFHPGPVLVVVKTGTITFYMGDDPSCTPHVHPAGTTFFENGGMVGIARNEGSVNATVVATFFVPAGSPTRLDVDAPGNCAF